jgi:hypothetical protein
MWLFVQMLLQLLLALSAHSRDAALVLADPRKQATPRLWWSARLLLLPAPPLSWQVLRSAHFER